MRIIIFSRNEKNARACLPWKSFVYLCERPEVAPDTTASLLGGLSLQSCFGVTSDEIGRDLHSNQGEKLITASLVRAYVLVLAIIGFQPTLAFAEEPELQKVAVAVASEDDPGVYRPSFISFDPDSVVLSLVEGSVQYDPVVQTFRYTFVDGTEVSGTVANIQLDHVTAHFSATFTIDSGPESGTYQVSIWPTDNEAGLGIVEVTDSSGVTLSTPIEPQMYAEPIAGSGLGYALGMHPMIAVVFLGALVIIVVEDAIWGDDAYNCSGFGYYVNGCWM